MIGSGDALTMFRSPDVAGLWGGRSARRIASGLALLALALGALYASPKAWTGAAPLVLCPLAAALIASGTFPSHLLSRTVLAASVAAVNLIVFPRLFHSVQQHRFGYTVLPDLIGFNLLMMYVGLPCAALLAIVLGSRRTR